MSKCVIYKLQESVNDDSLLKLNEMVVEFYSNDATKTMTLKCSADVTYKFSSNVTGTITNNPSFTDATEVFVPRMQVLNVRPSATNQVVKMSVSNKGNIVSWVVDGGIQITKINGLSWLKDITELKLNNCLNGNIDLSGLVLSKSLTQLDIQSAVGKTDISFIKDMPHLVQLNANYSDVKGDVSDFKFDSPFYFLAQRTPNLYGDLSKTRNIYFMSNLDGNSVFSWESVQEGDYVMAMQGILFRNASDVDNMLLSQADRQLTSQATTGGMWLRSISIKTQDGSTRTSASDSAVATLKAKGITITINNVTQQNNIASL